MTNLKPPLKWAGGKRWLVPTLKPLWEHHEHRRLVEPFVGGMAVSLGLNPAQALLNDINLQLINFYRWLWKGLEITIPMENDQDLYYAHRDRFNHLIAEGTGNAEVAQLFYYLNRTGFNGLCRFNKQGGYNVPFGKYKSISYNTPDLDNYRYVSSFWEFSCCDFEWLDISKNDFIYADPPYDTEFTQYSSTPFLWDEQVRLASWLAARSVPVVASNQATDRILDLYEGLGFAITIVNAPRRISCNGDRTPAKEMLATLNL